jgi:hypothetical protein
MLYYIRRHEFVSYADQAPFSRHFSDGIYVDKIIIEIRDTKKIHPAENRSVDYGIFNGINHNSDRNYAKQFHGDCFVTVLNTY